MKLKATLAAAIIAALAASCSSSPATTDDATNTAAADSAAVINNIMTRASVRQFTSQPIPEATMTTILRAGLAAPTAVNKQPWDVVVVTEREVLDSLSANHPHANLSTATAAVIVCGNMQKALEGTAQAYWIQDCSAVTENILLAAHACGLGAVWCGVYPSEERVAAVSRVLNLPPYIKPLNVIAMGYPAAPATPKDKWNPAAIHYQSW